MRKHGVSWNEEEGRFNVDKKIAEMLRNCYERKNLQRNIETEAIAMIGYCKNNKYRVTNNITQCSFKSVEDVGRKGEKVTLLVSSSGPIRTVMKVTKGDLVDLRIEEGFLKVVHVENYLSPQPVLEGAPALNDVAKILIADITSGNSLIPCAN